MSVRWVDNIGHQLFKSFTLSAGDSNISKPAGFYCTCGHYQPEQGVCSNKVIDNEKLLVIVRNQFGVRLTNYSELRDYFDRSHITENDLKDQNFRVTCNKVMIYKPNHTVDVSVVVDHVDSEIMQIYNDMKYNNNLSKDSKYISNSFKN